MTKKYEKEIIEILERIDRSETRDVKRKRRGGGGQDFWYRVRAYRLRVGASNFVGLVLLGSSLATAIVANFLRPNLPMGAFYLGLASAVLLLSPILITFLEMSAHPRRGENRWRGNVVQMRRSRGGRSDWRKALSRITNRRGRGFKR
ncbi:MAG: hypothetical protein M1358_01310 [Chloroflexi bacterium]|nr:hypothetical protein [Chloroflexota bacterium]